MADTGIDLSFLSSGGANLTLTIAQLQAMDAQLQVISARSPALLELSRAFGLTYAQAAKLTQELGVAPGQLSAAVGTMRSLRTAGADAVTQYAVLANQLGLTVDQMRLLADQVDELGDKKDVVADLTTALSSLFVLDKVNQFKAAIIETGKVMESLQTRLTTTLGTKAASDSALDRIQQFAATTPFEMVEVTDAFVKLKQRGIEPTNEALRSLGDLASSQGKSLNQTTEALLDAGQGEFERLKEYGIKASAAGDKVNVSFQGMNKQFERTPESITAGILSLGKLQGVAGGMELQSRTLTGAQSNLTDSQTKLAASTFALVQGPAIALVQTTTKLIDSFSELPAPIQLTILGVSTLAGVLVSAVAALAAFKAANIGVAISQGVSALASAPAAAALALSTAITKLATFAEMDLARAKGVTAVASSVLIGPLTAEAAAKAASAAATGAGTAATAAGTVVTASAAVTAGLLAAAVLGVGAATLAAVDSYQKANAAEIEGNKSRESLAKSSLALDQAYDKRVSSEKAAAKATVDGAEATRQASLSTSQRAAEAQAQDNKLKSEYTANLNERVGHFQLFLDKIREFIDLPKTALSKVFELTAQLPLPGPIKEFFKDVSESIDSIKLKSSTMLLRESDTNELANKFDDADRLKASKDRTQATAPDKSLSNASKGEVEALGASYTTLIEAAEKLAVADATQKTQKELLLKTLRAESEEVKQANKLILEKEKRIQSVGTAETQWAAEVKKVTENMGKQIATTEDANKRIEITKKQLANGFITQEQAATAFAAVAKYTQATGDVQQAAATELSAVKEKTFQKDKVLLESQLQLAELAGLGEVTNATETAVAVAQIKKQQADLEVAQLIEKLELLNSIGKGKSEEAVAAEKSLGKAKIDAQKAQFEEVLAARKEAQTRIEKAISDAADARQAAESKASTKVKTGTLDKIKSGDLSTEKADIEIAKQAAERQAVSLDAEIKLKISKQKELSSILGKDATDAAKKLSLEILQLQDKAADLELASIKRVQKAKLDAIRETAEKAKSLLDLANATGDKDSSAAEVAAYAAAGEDKRDVEEQVTKTRQEASDRRLRIELGNIEKERDATLAIGLSKEETEKNRIAFAIKTESKLAEINKLALEKLKANEADRIRARDDAARQVEEESKSASDALTNSKNEEDIARDSALANTRLLAARGDAKAIEDLANGAADAKDGAAFRQATQARELAQIEIDALNQRVSAGLVASKDIQAERDKLTAKLTAASGIENQLVEASIAYEKRKREELAKYRLSLFDQVKQALSQEQDLIAQSNSLAAARGSLEAAQNAGRSLAVQSRKQELDLAKQAADKIGNKSLAEALSRKSAELELNVIRAQADEIRRQYDTKLAMLELDLKSKEISQQQLVLEKEMAVVEAKSQLESGRSEGKSAVELDILKSKVALSERVLGLANQGTANTAKIATLQRDTLAVERGNAVQSNLLAQRAAVVKQAIDSPGKQGANNAAAIAANGLNVSTQAELPSKVAKEAELPTIAKSAGEAIAQAIALQKLPAPDYSAITASSKLLSSSFENLAKKAKKVEKPTAEPDGGGIRMSGARATGGWAGTSGATLVGEYGPELVTFAQQAYVHTAGQTSQMLKPMRDVSVLPNDSAQSKQLLHELQKLNSSVAKSRDPGSINMPVNVTANDANAVAQAIAIVRADRSARLGRL